MNADNLVLLACFAMLALLIFQLARRRQRPTRVKLLHLALCAAYALPLLLAIELYSVDYSGVVWYIYLLAAFGIHMLIVAGMLLFGRRDREHTTIT